MHKVKLKAKEDVIIPYAHNRDSYKETEVRKGDILEGTVLDKDMLVVEIKDYLCIFNTKVFMEKFDIVP